MIDKKSALIINFTANSYHWGCYGTSMELYNTLNDMGFYTNTISVSTVHGVSPSPITIQDFDSHDFVKNFFNANKQLYNNLNESDVVIVNGEGTLHRLHQAPRNLLYVIYAARKYLGKPVHLVNFSCYPSGDDSLVEPAATLYSGVLRTLNHNVVREKRSASLLAALNVPASQGFDCLPRFIRRSGVVARTSVNGPILLAGSVAMSEDAAAQIARTASRFAHAGRKIRFLSGAKAAPAPEDAAHFSIMQGFIPDLELIVAGSMTEWLEQINQAACLISGRFHHTLAAATLDTPVVVFPSNTPKIEAICDMLGLLPPIASNSSSFADVLEARLQEAVNGAGGRISLHVREEVIGLAKRNFDGLAELTRR